METKKQEQSAVYEARLAKANRTALNCHLITVVILVLAYLLEVFKGTKTISYFLMLALLGGGPVALGFFFYRIKATHPMVKHLVAFGFAVFYITILFTTENALVFVYVVPMLIAITIYNDVRYSLEVGAAVVVVNFIQVMVFYGKDGFEQAEIASAEIQLMALIVIAVFSYYTAKVSFSMNHAEIERAENEKKRSEELLEKVLQTSSQMTQVIEGVSGKIAVLGDAIQNTQNAMNELAEGTNDTAEAIQSQLTQTEVIASRVNQVKETSDQIADNMKETRKTISTGNEYVGHLVKQVAQTSQMNVQIASELGQLKTYMEQMFSIIEMINEITSQTSLLSLNASIEAARAGEAGKGFAVVASEISRLAAQTQDATVNIESMIQNVSAEIGKVVDIIEGMILQIEKQNEAVGETARSFERISSNAEDIERNSEGLTYAIKELKSANDVISESIQTISAISEEVAAHTNVTYTSCVENEKTIEDLIEKAKELTGLAEQLNA